MNTTLALYLKYLRLKRECAAYVRANDARIVGDAMFRLNRVAFHSYTQSYKEPIYTLKNALIRTWYQRGYAQGVQLQTQTQTCWRCNGSGKDPYEREDWIAPNGQYFIEDNCIKCSGTGVWRQHRLYAFDFQVGGKYYRWHQPVNLVKYPVTPTCSTVTEWSRHAPLGDIEVIDISDRQQTEVDYCTVLEYLRWQGVPRADLHELMSARQVAKSLWKASRLYRHWRNARRAVKRWRKRDKQVTDIPF